MRVTIISLVFLLMAQGALACQCPIESLDDLSVPEKVMAAIGQRNMVFIGRVINKEKDAEHAGAYFVDVKVQKDYTGTLESDVVIYESMCNFKLDVGEDYLIFAQKDQNEYVLNGCWTSGILISQAKEEIDFLKMFLYGEFEIKE